MWYWCLSIFFQYNQVIKLLSGMTLEVPNSDTEVENVSENYNRYNDTKNNLTIQSWSCKNINDEYNTNASINIGKQIGENLGNNSTYDNVSVYNKSGIYTYLDLDSTKGCMIVITGTNINDVIYAVKTLDKSQVSLPNETQNQVNSMSMLINSTEDSINEAITGNSSNEGTTGTTSVNDNSQSSSAHEGEVYYSPDEIYTAHTPQDVKQRMFDESDANGDGKLTGSEIDTMDYKLTHSQYTYTPNY